MLMPCITLMCSFVAAPVPVVNPFVAELYDLERQDWNLSRNIRVVAWERSITKYAGHRQVGKAMISVGHLLANEDLAHKPPMKADEAGSLEWFRKAVRASKPGSDLWVEAQFLVASRVVCGKPAEARTIYEAIAAKRSDSLTLIRIEHGMATVCSMEGDRAGSLRHDKNVVNWYRDDPRRRPADSDLQREIDSVIQSASGGMTQYITSFPLSKRERAAMIRKVMEDAPFLSPIQEAGENALKILDSFPEYVP